MCNGHPLMKLALAAVAPVLALSLGCSDDHPETVRVTGRVTLNGGAWPKSGLLMFLPTQGAEGLTIRPATAPFDENGEFEAQTWKPGSGVIPGSYKIYVECWIHPPSMIPGDPPAQSAVPIKYQSPDTSGMTLEVTRGSGRQKVEWDIR